MKLDYYDIVLEDDLSYVEKLLGEHPSIVRECNELGMSLLALAVQFENFALVKLLVSKGAPIDCCDVNKGGEPAIKVAASYMHREMFEFLKNNGADVNARGWMGVTAEDVRKENGW